MTVTVDTGQWTVSSKNVHGQLDNVQLFFYDFLRSRYNTYKANSFMFAFYHFKHVDLEKERKEN